MPKWMVQIDNTIERVERAVLVSLFTLLISLVCINIFSRNILHFTSHDLQELAPNVVLWLALVGGTLALKQQRHIKIELLLRFFPPTAQRLAISLTCLFAMAVCTVLAFAGIPFVWNEVALFGLRGCLAGCYTFFFSLAFWRFLFRLLSVVQHPKGRQG